MKVFEKLGYKVTVKEMDKNLIVRNMIDMLPARSITHAMMKISLAYLMFLKRKRYEKIEARGCTNDSSQREDITKLESCSPCVKTHTLFLNCLVDAFKNSCGVIAYVPGAFLLADWPEDTSKCHIRFESAMVKILCQIRPEYWKLIQYTKMKSGGTRKVLVGKITKAIY